MAHLGMKDHLGVCEAMDCCAPELGKPGSYKLKAIETICEQVENVVNMSWVALGQVALVRWRLFRGLTTVAMEFKNRCF